MVRGPTELEVRPVEVQQKCVQRGERTEEKFSQVRFTECSKAIVLTDYCPILMLDSPGISSVPYTLYLLHNKETVEKRN